MYLPAASNLSSLNFPQNLYPYFSEKFHWFLLEECRLLVVKVVVDGLLCSQWTAAAAAALQLRWSVVDYLFPQYQSQCPEDCRQFVVVVQ